ncbi:MAG: hypothetical protein QM811_25020 [Pirellulales bacterium]
MVDQSRRPYVFSTAHPPAFAAAALAALDIVRDEPQRRERLLTNAAALCASFAHRAGRWARPRRRSSR